ncbi:MAG: hybrid sensor histidine kinase/response regulator [Lentisphaerota bacterium]
MATADARYKVLVIDDECGPRESLRILLKNDYEVHCADSVNKGLELLKEQKPDAVVMDIRMPGKTGLEGLKELRDLDPHVSVIMLTGFGALETAQEALRLGANDYLKKPFDAVSMQETIRLQVRRTHLERLRSAASGELEEANRRLVRELDQKEHMAYIGQSSKELIHDLCNPLTAVLGYVELLTHALKPCQVSYCPRSRDLFNYIREIENDLRRCRDLLDMWQSLSRNSDKISRPIRLDLLLADLTRGLEPLAMRAGARVNFQSTSHECYMMGDETQIYRALNNVLVNAVHAAGNGRGQVKISCSAHNSRAEIRVEDNGCGIEPAHLDKIFDPYFTTKEKGQGSGLGLFIARKILESHHGSITAESRVNEGSTFQISLPLADFTEKGHGLQELATDGDSQLLPSQTCKSHPKGAQA